MFKIENRFSKSNEKNLNKELMMDAIREAEEEKAKIFMDMGILLYKKIREQEIDDPSFEKMSEELIRLDKVIYENSNKLEHNNQEKNEIECECGKIIKEENKFCSQCGKMIEVVEEIEKIECLSCGVKIDRDSSYCVCCGSKLNNQIYIDEK